VSPDGTRVAVGVPDANGDLALWVYSVNTGAGLRLTQQGGTNTPVWVSNDRIAFWSNAQGASGQIDTVEADGSGHPEQLLVSPSGIFGDFPTSFDVARHDLIFTRLLTAAHREIFRLPLQQGAEADPVLQGAFNRGNAELSPDGRWLVYRSDQSGAMEVYLQAYPGPGPTVPVSIGGGASVTWFPDGKALGYRLADQMMSVSVETGTGAPRIGRPTELFRGSYFASPNGSRQYHIAPDGRFLMLKSSPGSTAGALPPQVVLVQNWLQELNARVPTR
jgi:hypothetical protein